MPGYTKDQLAAMNADPSQFKWCRKGCKLHWSKRGFASHARACGTDTKFLVNIATPPMPDPQPGDVVIIQPAFEQFARFLIEASLKLERDGQQKLALQGEGYRPPAAEAPPAPRRGRDRKRRRADAQSLEVPEFDVITVDEAIVRYGLSREEIMAKFDTASDVVVVKPSST